MSIGGWSRDEVARRISEDLRDGWYVNLGIGLPLLVPGHLRADCEVMLHAEHGLLGIGPAPEADPDPDLIDAGKNLVTLGEGGAAMDSAMSFAIVRGGHLDVAIIGALQVSSKGDLANWLVPGRVPGVGGAMDLVVGARRVWVAMEHSDRLGAPKFVNECTLPLTGARCVDRLYTTRAVFDFRDGRAVLVDLAPGESVDSLRAVTAAEFEINLVTPGAAPRGSHGAERRKRR